ncbi:MAG: hypothetical protein AAEJ46_07535, partial [Planctomycetota bacterium]
ATPARWPASLADSRAGRYPERSLEGVGCDRQVQVICPERCRYGRGSEPSMHDAGVFRWEAAEDVDSQDPEDR